MIANSGHDERGKYTGGTAGDQTGAEWQIRTWYNRPWNCVLRHPDKNVREQIAKLARAAANNNKIGYNQGRRLTFWYALQNANYDPAKITVACDSDCSAGVCAIVKAVGYIVGNQKLKDVSITNWTGSMKTNLRAAGFEVLTDKKYLTSDAYLIPGDILLNEQHHTCINLDYGSKVSKPAESANSAKATKGYSGGFPIIPPSLKKGSKGSQVDRLQRFLNWFGNYGLVTDGDFGKKTLAAVKDFQKRTGLSVDGVFGPKSLAMAKVMEK